MSGFVKLPGQPENASVIVIGEKYSDILSKPLQNRGILPIKIPDNPCVDERLSGHADLSLLHAGGDRCFLAECFMNTDFVDKLYPLGVKLIPCCKEQGKKYPNDAGMNCLAVGNCFFYSNLVTDINIVNYFTNDLKLIPISTRQGYTACSVSIVDDRSMITADRGIASAAEKRGYNVLLIEHGHIDLPGFEYGFIGGATFKLSSGEIAFTGRLDGHPDKDRILGFLNSCNVEPVFLTDMPIFDIGGAVAIEENKALGK